VLPSESTGNLSAYDTRTPYQRSATSCTFDRSSRVGVFAVMSQYVAFLRAVNVAGHGRLSMESLRSICAECGLEKVRTYIQTGNVIFECSPRELRKRVRALRQRLETTIGGQPEIMLRTVDELAGCVSAAPFAALAENRDVKLYVCFLMHRPLQPVQLPMISESECLEAVAMSEREVFVVSGRKSNGFYGFPNNFVEAQLRVPATSRNWNTVGKVLAMAQSAGPARAI